MPTKKNRDEVKRDAAHDPRKFKGAKEKAAKMKARSKTFSTTAKSKSANMSGPFGSGLLEGARRALKGRKAQIEKAIGE